ncbi:MAG: ribosome maturation factor RimM [Chloroflexi bacterium]|nr:ribosome maturation factor RimM [Chloroflexota bacterium]
MVIGRITRPHGIVGEVKVQLEPEYLDALDPKHVRRVYLGDADAATGVKSARMHQGAMLLKLEGVDDRNAAEAMRATLVRLDRQDLPALPTGEFYATDLVGMHVFDMDGVELGVLAEVLATGSNDVFVVTRPQGELLLPVIDSCVKEIDPAALRIRVVVPDGL